jgi:NDP-sugar pyrophosphorylase family protein
VVLDNAVIGANSRIRRAIIDCNCEIPPGTRIGYDAVADAQRFTVSPQGVVLVTREMLALARLVKKAGKAGKAREAGKAQSLTPVKPRRGKDKLQARTLRA